jgi:hypothetical protein
MKRALVRALALLAVPVALVLVGLAVEALRVPRALEADDVRFAAAPRVPRALWTDLSAAPGRAGEQVLGIEDDIAYRRTVALYSRIKNVAISGPELEALSGQALLEVTLASKSATDARRQAQLLNFLGAMTLSRFSTIPAEREILLRTGIGAFRSAVLVDPENVDAKRNLELALRLPGVAELPGLDPDAGGSRGQRSGAGREGTGY